MKLLILCALLFNGMILLKQLELDKENQEIIKTNTYHFEKDCDPNNGGMT